MRGASIILSLLLLAFGPCSAQESRRAQRDELSRQAAAEAEMKERVNASTVGFAAGLLEGAPIRFASDIGRVVNSGQAVHVLPVVTRGPTENVNDLLYLRGIDIAIINSDSLDEYRAQVPQIGQRIVQILNLFPSELHVFVRPEISSLADLAGKKVNFNTQGTAAAYSGPLIFSRLGIEPERIFEPHPVAIEKLRKGEIAAVVFVTSKPVDAFAKQKWPEGFKFLAVEHGSRLADYYVPASLEASDYPALIKPDQHIATIAVPTVLASFNWKPGTAGYGRVSRFVDELLGKLDTLRSPGFDPRWKDVDVTAAAPGLKRFARAQEWIEHRPTMRSQLP